MWRKLWVFTGEFFTVQTMAAMTSSYYCCSQSNDVRLQKEWEVGNEAKGNERLVRTLTGEVSVIPGCPNSSHVIIIVTQNLRSFRVTHTFFSFRGFVALSSEKKSREYEGYSNAIFCYLKIGCFNLFLLLEPTGFFQSTFSRKSWAIDIVKKRVGGLRNGNSYYVTQ